MNPLFEMRLVTKAAHLYWIEQMRQVEIASRLSVSQATVSRLLKRAHREGIVSVSIHSPQGIYPELEQRLAAALGLREVVVNECSSDTEQAIVASIGEAAAFYLESTLAEDDVIGLSSWSSALQAMSERLSPNAELRAEKVVQLLGGMASSGDEHLAETLTRRISTLVGARAHFMHVAGMASSAQACQVMLSEPYVQETVRLFERVSLALLGIGTLEPSKFLARSGNTFSKQELASLAETGAVGDVCLRFFDRDGRMIDHPLNQRVISIEPQMLERIERRIGVAGGAHKVEAIIGAARGGWIHTLITDRFTAQRILEWL
ncbi:sugar-binding transcriptional regulator [Halotalea alkalilenta]|uniref:Sugar-binding domain-containing protein n=1 Tax=Halotalea alkalilenta TaxID=376489 RepID=A0A172YC08_9GAMM|nr:sugar-binding transcriptional regulator [Halotalea alkalilenta]ANF56754.1 hypothetical protein A5892_04120 [Halotalea alkalilenta]